MENKLLISSVFKSLSLLRKIGYKKIIQNKKFKYGIRIKNINNKPFEGGLIKNALIYQSGVTKQNAIVISFDKDFKIPPLNPNKVCLIWLDKLIVPFSGGMWIKLDIESEKTTFIYQWDRANKIPQKVAEDNKFNSLFYIENENNFLQKITNLLLIILTLILVVKEVFL